MEEGTYHGSNLRFTNHSRQRLSESLANRRSGDARGQLRSGPTHEDLHQMESFRGAPHYPQSDIPVPQWSPRHSDRLSQPHVPFSTFGHTSTVFSGPENFTHTPLENLRSTESAPGRFSSRLPSEVSGCLGEQRTPLGVSETPPTSSPPMSTMSSVSSNDSLPGVQDYDFVEPLASKYECPICIQVLNNPVQTECGHRFCKACLLRWLNNESACHTCPVCNSQLSEDHVYPDNFAKREINSLKVFCPHHSEGCVSIMELSRMQKHLGECDFLIVVCPNGCSASFQRKSLKSHLLEKCPRRLIKCALCKADIVFNDKESHLSLDCPYSTVQCDSCGEEIPRKEVESHKFSCPQVVISCDFADFGCTAKFHRGQNGEHQVIAQPDHLCLIASKLRSLLKSTGTLPSFEDKLKHVSPASSSSSSSLNAGSALSTMHKKEELLELLSEFVRCNIAEDDSSSSSSKKLTNPGDLEASLRAALKQPSSKKLTAEVRYNHERSNDGLPATVMSENKSLREKLADMESKHTSLQRRMEEHFSQCHHPSSSTLDTLTDLLARSCNGLYIWHVTEYSKRKREAIRGEMTVLHSPGFYTGSFGYKLCIRLNLNGVDAALGTHMSLFVHFMQGEFDSYLTWPFKGSILLSILDQQDNCDYQQHISENLEAKPHLLAFHRPTSPRNHKGFGYMEFAPISLIEQPNFIKNDTLVIKAIVRAYT